MDAKTPEKPDVDPKTEGKQPGCPLPVADPPSTEQRLQELENSVLLLMERSIRQDQELDEFRRKVESKVGAL